MLKKMTSAEQNYTITENKMLAIIQAVKEWRKYLEGLKTRAKIITDHKNLTYFQEAKITNRQQARWALEYTRRVLSHNLQERRKERSSQRFIKEKKQYQAPQTVTNIPPKYGT